MEWEWRMPFVPAQASVLALAFFRTLWRAPEARIMLIMPLLMTLLFGGIIMRKPTTDLSLFLEPFLPAALTVMLLFGLIQMAMNHFGLDRSGFRALMLIPVARWEVLLAKNLSLFGLGLALNLGLLLLLVMVRGLSWDIVLGGLFQFMTGFLMLSMMGNWASVLWPYRIAPGSLQSNKMPVRVTLLIFASHVLLPVALLPVFLPSVAQVVLHHFGRAIGVPVSLLLAAALLGLTAVVYRLVLRSQGRLLSARETQVLATVTASLD